jgi:hypothetical protein
MLSCQQKPFRVAALCRRGSGPRLAASGPCHTYGWRLAIGRRRRVAELACRTSSSSCRPPTQARVIPMLASDHRTSSYACDANSRRAALLTQSRGLYLCPKLRRGEAGLDAELSRRATPRYSSLDSSQLARRPLRPRLEGYPQCSGGEIGPMDCPLLAVLTKGARLGRH